MLANESFDTLGFANKLKKAGVDGVIAEAQAEVMKNTVGYLVEVNKNDAATQKDLLLAKSELRQEIGMLRNELTETKAELKQDIAEVRTEIAEVRSELKQDISKVRAEITEVRAEMSKMEARLLKSITGIVVTSLTLFSLFWAFIQHLK